jgi:hypothetical protein
LFDVSLLIILSSLSALSAALSALSAALSALSAIIWLCCKLLSVNQILYKLGNLFWSKYERDVNISG